MDSPDFPAGKSPRSLQGPRPTPLRVYKDSHKIRKPPVVPQPHHHHHHHHHQHHQQQQQQFRPPVIIYTVSPKLEMKKACMVKERFNETDNNFNGRWKWKKKVFMGDEITEWIGLYELLEHVSLNDQRDSWEWIGDSSGSFSVRAIKRDLGESLIGDDSCKFEWINWVPLKCNIFMWRALNDRIPTMTALAKRNIIHDELDCFMCDSGIESANHLLTGCWVASIILENISKWCRTPPIYAFSIKDLLDTGNMFGKSGDELIALKGIIRTACWCIWVARNKKRFDNADVSINNILGNIRALSYMWYKNRKSKNSISWSNWCNFVLL